MSKKMQKFFLLFLTFLGHLYVIFQAYDLNLGNFMILGQLRTGARSTTYAALAGGNN